jgi:integrase
MPRKPKPWYWSSRKRWATTIGGVRIVAPASVDTEHKAWAWHDDVTKGSVVPSPTGEPTVLEVVEEYIHWSAGRVAAGARRGWATAAERSCLQTVCNTKIAGDPFGDMRIATLNAGHFDALVAAWRSHPYSPGYVAAMTRRIKTVMAWAARPLADRKPLIPASPFAACKAPPVPATAEKFGARELAARWLRWLRKSGFGEDAAFQRCLIHTGARPSELAWATWSDVNWDGAVDSSGHRMAVLTRAEWKNSAKSGRRRRIYLPARLVRMLRRRAEGRGPGDLIFPRPTGGRHERSDLAARICWLKRKAAEAGVVLEYAPGKTVSNYLWRHTAASTLLMRSVDVATVAELLGTSAQLIQRTYGHLLDDHLAAASSRLSGRR